MAIARSPGPGEQVGESMARDGSFGQNGQSAAHGLGIDRAGAMQTAERRENLGIQVSGHVHAPGVDELPYREAGLSAEQELDHG